MEQPLYFEGYEIATHSTAPSALLGTWLRAGLAATDRRGSDGRETWGDAYATYRGADRSDRLDELDRSD